MPPPNTRAKREARNEFNSWEEKREEIGVLIHTVQITN
jgi:hypothetical protein